MQMALCNWNKPMPFPALGRAGRTTRRSGRRAAETAAERREAARLLSQWQTFSGDGLPPSLDDLLRFLGEDGWNRRFLIAQDPDPQSSVLITCGEAIAAVLGSDVKGRTLRDIVWDGCRSLLDGCIEAAQTRLPTTIEGTLSNHACASKPFRAVILPFGNKRDCIPYLFGAVGWSEGTDGDLLPEGH